MIPAKHYFTFYLIFITIITFFVYYKYSTKNGNITYPLKQRKQDGTFLLALLMTIFIGFRPINAVFVDMLNYVDFYHALYKNVIFIWIIKNC